MTNRPDVPEPSEEALKDLANAARRVLTRPGDELTSVFMLTTAVDRDDQLFMQAVMWPEDASDAIRDVLQRFLDGRPGWDGGPVWEEL